MGNFGATSNAWLHFCDTLGLQTDLLPVVSNLSAVISERSTMVGLGKTPSVYNRERHAIGLAKWTSRYSTRRDIVQWMQESDYGISLQTRSVRAIDIDVSDPTISANLERAVQDALGVVLPKRSRSNSGKMLLAFRLDEPMTKRVIPCEGGIIEFLGDGQQFIASGQHTSGVRYEWDGGAQAPDQIPTISKAQLEMVWLDLCCMFANGEPKIAGERRKRHAIDDLEVRDDRTDHLAANWEVYGNGNEGQAYIRCPFESEHTSDSGITSTAYFPAGTGGFERGHYVCLHAHCEGRTDNDFDHAVGFLGASFEPIAPATRTEVQEIGGVSSVVEVAKAPWPKLDRTNAGNPETTLRNLKEIINRPDICGTHVAWDDFSAELMCAPYRDDVPMAQVQWERFSDDDYFTLQLAMEHLELKKVSRENIVNATRFVAREHRMDSAQLWLSRLQWDGVPRVDRFMRDYWGAQDTPYTRAVSRYVWTGHAGRVIQPGVQADMAAIFKSPQGERKTTAIKAMVPSLDQYITINLEDRDANLSRSLRGKLVGELEELRGLNSRDAESIKAWITRTEEEWVPKFKEFGTKFNRRLLLHGTTNEGAILADPTGERRWLPSEVAVAGDIKPELIARDCEQLWAEGATLFLNGGIAWADAERLAKGEHVKFKTVDAWSRLVTEWVNVPDMSGETLAKTGRAFTATSALQGAVGVSAQHIGAQQVMRMRRVLIGLGYRASRDNIGDEVWINALG